MTSQCGAVNYLVFGADTWGKGCRGGYACYFPIGII